MRGLLPHDDKLTGLCAHLGFDLDLNASRAVRLSWLGFEVCSSTLPSWTTFSMSTIAGFMRPSLNHKALQSLIGRLMHISGCNLSAHMFMCRILAVCSSFCPRT